MRKNTIISRWVLLLVIALSSSVCQNYDNSDIMVIAHRGYHRRLPPNTLESFQAALDTGVEAIEFDMHFTIDGDPVINHDASFLGSNGEIIVIKDSSLAYIQAHGLKEGKVSIIPSN